MHWVLTLNVITKDLAVALSSSLSETLNTTNNGQLNNRKMVVAAKGGLTFPPLPRPDMLVDLLEGCRSVEEGLWLESDGLWW